MWASTLCPFSSSTRNMALGRGSTTVPSTSMTSSLAKLQTPLPRETHPWAHEEHASGRASRQYTGRSVALSTQPGSGPLHDRLDRVQLAGLVVRRRLDQDRPRGHGVRSDGDGHLDHDGRASGEAHPVRPGHDLARDGARAPDVLDRVPLPGPSPRNAEGVRRVAVVLDPDLERDGLAGLRLEGLGLVRAGRVVDVVADIGGP